MYGAKKFLLSFVGALVFGFMVVIAVSCMKKKQEEELSFFIEKFRQEYNIPGLAVGILKDGKVLLAKGFGLRDIKQKKEVTADTIFPIGSCTKAFTATSLGILVDQKKLDWDDPIVKYLPTFGMYDEYVTKHVTIRDALLHRTGLARHEDLWGVALDCGRFDSRYEIVKRIKYLEPLPSGYRSIYSYNNHMYVVAGVVLERIYRNKWETFVQKNIFDPLSMKRSNFSIEVSKKDNNFALPYEKKGQNIIDAFFVNLSGVGPSGTINSTVNDMLKWVGFNLDSEKFKKIISNEILEEIHEAQMLMDGEILKEMPELSYSSYGLGWFVSNYRGYHWLRHSGEINGFTAEIAMLPLDNIGIVLLANLDEGLAILKVLEFSLFDRLVAKLSENKVDWNRRLRKYLSKQEEAELEEEKKMEKKITFDRGKFKFDGKFLHKAYGIIEFKDDQKVLRGRLNDVSFDVIFHEKSDDGLVFKTANGMRYGKAFEGGNNLKFLLKIKKNVVDKVVLLGAEEGNINVEFKKAM